MLTPAAEKLSSPCLPESFTEVYHGWPFLITFMAVLAMQLVDYVVEQVYTAYVNRSASKEDAAAAGAPQGAIISIHSSRAMLGSNKEAGHAHSRQAEEGDEEAGSAGGEWRQQTSGYVLPAFLCCYVSMCRGV
jgi:hypothetical protein